ncbi:MAG: DUF5615 family PIN-like protein [Chitinophagales bacterium]
MKYLVDAQLPKKLSFFIQSKGMDCIHTLDLQDKNKSTDKTIREFSEIESRIVISKDADFLESFMVNNKPEKLLLIKTGNISNKRLIEIFDMQFITIDTFFAENNLIELTQTEIIIHE